jgi:hypothetical protein
MQVSTLEQSGRIEILKRYHENSWKVNFTVHTYLMFLGRYFE